MAVAQALQAASTGLRRNPLIAGIVLVLLLIQLSTQFVQLAGPLVSAAFSAVVSIVTIVVAPFLFGGLIGMADEALDGTTSFDTFLDTGKQYYTSMLGAYLIVLGGMIVIGLVASIISIVIVAAIGIGSGGPSGMSDPLFIAMFLVGTAVFVLILFIPMFFIQFYGQAIVVDDQSAVEGLKRSIGLVRSNLVSVFGYSMLVFGGGFFFGILGSIPSTLLSMHTMTQVPASIPFPELSLPVTVALSLIGNVLLGIVGSLFLVFSVAFYRILGSTVDTDSSNTTPGAST